MTTKTLNWFTDEKLNCVIYQVYQFEGTMAITSSTSYSIYSEKQNGSLEKKKEINTEQPLRSEILQQKHLFWNSVLCKLPLSVPVFSCN